ncbi:TlpA family protein disulfide reductase [Pedobacter africanus]|uniref:Thiol-disulfide isomerase/thioredoxin n=1 Tax=Pedobacter africanus TaxID=151894 RepID=A0ACC6KYN1_9SPHI|nr:TlpA disulfide reductase family protein [Pedobacter africanus]MDR6784377.1 thiol-disulfide isomerase/thioredoxin [Pedobacter africanus]
MLTCLLALLSMACLAQKTIVNPLVGFDGKNRNLKIVKVSLTDTGTVVSFMTTYKAGNWIRIPKNTYIQANGTNDKLFIKATKGIPFNKKYTIPESGKVNYELVFPKIDPTTSNIDYGEEGSEGWKIYDIELVQKQTPLPAFLYTEWYNKKNSDLTIAFYSKAVVFDKKVWFYKEIAKKNDTYILTIANNKSTKQIIIEKPGDKEIKLTVNKLTANLSSDKNSCAEILDKEIYKLPVLKNDSAVFSGYIKNYSPKLGTKILTLAIDNIITGIQENVLIHITPDGYFYRKIPVCHLQKVFLRSDIADENDLYLEPGKELFVILGNGSVKYAGNAAQLNHHLKQLNRIDQFDFVRMRKKLADMKPNDYKAHLLDLQSIESVKLDSINKLGKIPAKAYQVKKKDIVFEYANRMMEYHWNYEHARRQVFKLPDTVKVKIENYPDGYYNFIRDGDFNNELNVISNAYNTFINRFKFIPGFRKTRYVHNYKAMMAALKSEGQQASENDKAFEKIISNDGIILLTDSTNKRIHKKWAADHSEFINTFVSDFFRNSYYNAIDSAVGIKQGILIDLLSAQDISRPIIEQLTPLSAGRLASVIKKIDHPYLKDYVILKNTETLKQVELNKNAGGFFVNETPKVEADKIFDNMMSKFAGKVVLVDFWATWCGPCLGGISRIKPLKEEMKDSNIAFVYITNETSPLPTYQNMVPTIKGQHYRLNNDEWGYLADKFKISGIPHMVLVNKEGKVVNPRLGFMENHELKQLMEKHL